MCEYHYLFCYVIIKNHVLFNLMPSSFPPSLSTPLSLSALLLPALPASLEWSECGQMGPLWLTAGLVFR